MFLLLRSLNSIGAKFPSTVRSRAWRCCQKHHRRAIASDAFLRNEDTIKTLAASVSPRAFELVKAAYAHQRKHCSVGQPLVSSSPAPISTANVFANRQLDMGKISAIGFDYDYTLAAYKTSLQHFIYDEAKYHLLVAGGYPKQLADLKFEKDFAVRGLTFDRRTGML